MAINFDKLPDTAGGGFAMVPEGFHKAKIIKAEMRPARDTSLPDELNITLECYDTKGNKLGLVWDTLKDSDKQAQQYKIKRLFIDALNMDLSAMVELKDLAKLIQGKEVIVDIEHNEYNGKTSARVSMFNNEMYYPTSMEAELLGTGGITAAVDDDDELPFITDDSEGDEY